MRDIATLKERVDFAERHLKATETARSRESDALMDTWRRIRERFNQQENEIARYRAQVESLTENNEALSRMIDELIGIIDGNIDRGRDETVPRIASLAEDMLASEPSAADLERFADDEPDDEPAPPPEQADLALVEEFDDELDADDDGADEIIELGVSDDLDDALDLEAGEAEVIDLDIPSLDAEPDEVDEDDDGDGTEPVAMGTLSPGIRSLIKRVESSGADEGALTFDLGDVDDLDDDELARELREIELLRNELSGLRDRISAEDP